MLSYQWFENLPIKVRCKSVLGNFNLNSIGNRGLSNRHNWTMSKNYSVVEYFSEQEKHDCGYCKNPSTSFSYGKSKSLSIWFRDFTEKKTLREFLLSNYFLAIHSHQTIFNCLHLLFMNSVLQFESASSSSIIERKMF